MAGMNYFLIMRDDLTHTYIYIMIQILKGSVVIIYVIKTLIAFKVLAEIRKTYL